MVQFLQLGRIAQLGVEHDCAKNDRDDNCEIGHHRCVKWDAPRPGARKDDDEKCQRRGCGNERDDAKTSPHRVRPERTKLHTNPVV